MKTFGNLGEIIFIDRFTVFLNSFSLSRRMFCYFKIKKYVLKDIYKYQVYTYRCLDGSVKNRSI